MIPHKCVIEGCDGMATGTLLLKNKEGYQDLDVCASCYCGLTPDLKCDLCKAKIEEGNINIAEETDGSEHIICNICKEMGE